MRLWLIAFLYFLPAGFANLAPVLASKVPWLSKWQTPLDFGKNYQGKRILGDSKTWRGLVAGMVLAGLVSCAEWLVFYRPHHISFVGLALTIFSGMLMGFGALAGDAVESFFKRRVGVKPGDSWFPFDQIDYIIGGLLVTFPFAIWRPGIIVRIFILYFGLHLLLSYIAYLLGLKSKPI